MTKKIGPADQLAERFRHTGKNSFNESIGCQTLVVSSIDGLAHEIELSRSGPSNYARFRVSSSGVPESLVDFSLSDSEFLKILEYLRNF